MLNIYFFMKTCINISKNIKQKIETASLTKEKPDDHEGDNTLY